jgi:ubiquinone/menaquinone biosynthesis C-methylase UbiE
LGEGSGTCLEIGCGTGVHAAQIRELGWTPAGIDLSGAMLRHAQGRLPIALADAERLPVQDRCVPAVMAVMVHTDMPAYPAVLREVARVLRPGGRFAVSDVIADEDMDDATRADMQAYTGCIAGALTRQSFTQALLDAGLTDIEIRETHRVHPQAASAIVRARKSGPAS